MNKIELLIDERNALQHRYGSPNELTIIFYMEASVEFFTEVLKEQYDLDFYETISQFADEAELTALQLRKPTDDTELKKLESLAKIHPLGAFLSAMTYFERVIMAFGERVGIKEDLRGAPQGFGSHLSIYLITVSTCLPNYTARFITSGRNGIWWHTVEVKSRRRK
ncbi:MAG: hypothetical protein IID16_08550 [Candidatus Marinimicrobia bacterium]|nr:hypothetical protein [Candidatus Neomarinimicrobiota bacterium]